MEAWEIWVAWVVRVAATLVSPIWAEIHAAGRTCLAAERDNAKRTAFSLQ